MNIVFITLHFKIFTGKTLQILKWKSHSDVSFLDAVAITHNTLIMFNLSACWYSDWLPELELRHSVDTII